jgi:hypothetical protein
LLGLGRGTTAIRYEGILPDTDSHEGVAGGVCFIDPAGVNLQVYWVLLARGLHVGHLGILIHNICIKTMHACAHSASGFFYLIGKLISTLEDHTVVANGS